MVQLALSPQRGNCCDLTHLTVALLRAAGIPARYRHVYCKFTNITCGNVVAQAYVDGTWYNLDASNNSNGWNVIGGTLLETYGYYQSLPF
jgi:transglutaminase-like putative cysteine protease